MSEDEGGFCPDHSRIGDDVLQKWGRCPDDCRYFVGELEDRIHEVRVRGNFTRMWTDQDGQCWRQLYRNHEPVGEPDIPSWS